MKKILSVIYYVIIDGKNLILFVNCLFDVEDGFDVVLIL